MFHRDLRILIILLFSGALTPMHPIPARAADSRQEKPNIILILCDDMGFSDLGCYGGEIRTPNLDRLAANGIRFTDFHNNAKCSETRATLLTGLWHQQTGMLRRDDHATIPQLLAKGGYHTAISGKWHLDGHPMDHGFTRFFGFLGGTINYFTGTGWGSRKPDLYYGREPWTPDADFYSTDAFTDQGIRFIEEMTSGTSGSDPFFLYLAYNAPHFPLQAPPEDIASYRGLYDEGWDELRRQRYESMLRMGLISEDSWRLSPRDPKVEAWESLTPPERQFLIPMMEVYAAMVDRLDQNIGRLIESLEESGRLESTLICFLSDNGACPYQRLRTDKVVPGTSESEIAYDARWANLCNTPLRLYKQYAHHGGTLTPMIAHWPAGIGNPGTLESRTAHIVDIFPTLLEISGVGYPDRLAGNDLLPLEGLSFADCLQSRTPLSIHLRPVPIFWEFNGHHAVRSGPWKLVAERGAPWELYQITSDVTETRDLSAAHPEIVSSLNTVYNKWAERVGATQHSGASKLSPSTQSQLFDLSTITDQTEPESER